MAPVKNGAKVATPPRNDNGAIKDVAQSPKKKFFQISKPQTAPTTV